MVKINGIEKRQINIEVNRRDLITALADSFNMRHMVDEYREYNLLNEDGKYYKVYHYDSARYESDFTKRGEKIEITKDEYDITKAWRFLLDKHYQLPGRL